jgi:O-antigen/teichoic acid export membrane protein
VSNGIKVALILGEAPLLAFAAITALEGMASALALILAYRRLRTDAPWKLTRKVATSMLSESWPFMLSGFAVVVYMRIDQIMVKELLGTRELGIYAVALPISQFWQVLPLTIATSVAPFLARQRLADELSYRRSIVLAFRGFFYIGVLSSIVTYGISGWLIPLLFGPAYAEAVTVLNVHAISNVFCFLGIAHGLWLVNERRFAVRLYGTVAAGLSTIALNFLLLPLLGLIGACIAAIVAQAIAAFLVNAIFDRRSFWLQVEAIAIWKV